MSYHMFAGVSYYDIALYKRLPCLICGNSSVALFNPWMSFRSYMSDHMFGRCELRLDSSLRTFDSCGLCGTDELVHDLSDV